MELTEINKRLAADYGHKGDINYPRFRIVFSDDALEQRRFKEDFYYEGKYLSSGDRVEWTKKYPFITGKHVFEVHSPTDEEEIVDKGGNYEPLYVFEDDQKNPLPLDWDMIQYLCRALNERPELKNARMLQAEEDERMAKAVQLEYEILDNNSPYLATMLNNKEAVFLDSKKVMK